MIKKHKLLITDDESHTCSPTNLYISMYLYIRNRKIEFMHIVVEAFRSYYLQLFSFSTSLCLSFYFTTTPQAFNEWKKNLFWSIYATVCIYRAFIQHNFFILYFLSTFLFSTYFTVQFSLARQIVRIRARGEISRLLRNLFKTFCFAFCYFTILFFLLKVSERQQFHRNFWFVFFAFIRLTFL